MRRLGEVGRGNEYVTSINHHALGMKTGALIGVERPWIKVHVGKWPIRRPLGLPKSLGEPAGNGNRIGGQRGG